MLTAYGTGGLDLFVVPLAMALGRRLASCSLLVYFAYSIFLAIFDDLVWLVQSITKAFHPTTQNTD